MYLLPCHAYYTAALEGLSGGS